MQQGAAHPLVRQRFATGVEQEVVDRTGRVRAQELEVAGVVQGAHVGGRQRADHVHLTAGEHAEPHPVFRDVLDGERPDQRAPGVPGRSRAPPVVVVAAQFYAPVTGPAAELERARPHRSLAQTARVVAQRLRGLDTQVCGAQRLQERRTRPGQPDLHRGVVPDRRAGVVLHAEVVEPAARWNRTPGLSSKV